LSSREYFWNPYAFEANPNTKPSTKTILAKDGMTVRIPPYSVKVFQFTVTSPLSVLLPKSEFCDMKVEGWVRAFQPSGKPCEKDLGVVTFKVEGPAKIATPKVVLANSAAKFILQPEGKAGEVTVTAKCGDREASKTITFKPVDLIVYLSLANGLFVLLQNVDFFNFFLKV